MQRTDVRKGGFFTYTHYNTREEVLKIRTREEAVFGAREAREQEKLRQMLAKKNKGPLTGTIRRVFARKESSARRDLPLVLASFHR